MKKLIKVTQRDIDAVLDSEYTANSCPVARAINRSFKKKVANVNEDGVIFMNNINGFLKTDVKIKDFVSDFDNYHGGHTTNCPEPFEFYLEY